MVAAPAASSRQSAPAFPHRSRQPEACQSKSPSGHQAGARPGTRRSTRLAFTSPSVRLKGTMLEARRNDWLRAGKRAMCVSIF
jgi:hypothetical protein